MSDDASPPDPTSVRVGAEIRRLRTAHGWSMEELGRRVKRLYPDMAVGHSTVHKWERGENIPKFDKLEAVFDALGSHAHIMMREKGARSKVLAELDATLQSVPLERVEVVCDLAAATVDAGPLYQLAAGAADLSDAQLELLRRVALALASGLALDVASGLVGTMETVAGIREVTSTAR